MSDDDIQFDPDGQRGDVSMTPDLVGALRRAAEDYCADATSLCIEYTEDNEERHLELVVIRADAKALRDLADALTHKPHCLFGVGDGSAIENDGCTCGAYIVGYEIDTALAALCGEGEK
jgi:hypothetical protein